MWINNTHHLTYCTNIHPGADWETTFKSLEEYVPVVKNAVSKDESFGLGLRLSNTASKELDQGDNISKFKEWLLSNNIYVFTMNGFPYGNFHNERVKDMVHAPDWTTPERLDYTKRLFQQLAYLIPDGVTGGISTSPISYKHWHRTEELKHVAFEKGARNLVEIALQLKELEDETGKYLHLDIEPEPDGLIENSGEVLHFFSEYLVPIAKDVFGNHFGMPENEAEKIVKRYITVCYDICHFSLAYEEPEYTFEQFSNVGIRIGKIQVSAALKIIFDQKQKETIWETLSNFNESTYLHQVTEKVGDTVKTYNDLPVVLEKKNDFKELRAHFHVPIFLERFGSLFSTQDHILKVITALKSKTISEHLEIETYTWEVLPTALKKELSESIIREINWLTDRL